MRFYFYKITNLINNKFYYGSGQFNNYKGSGSALKNARKKYGDENFKFEILRRFESREEAYTFESRFLKLFKISSLKQSYNQKDAGLGGDTLSNHPDREHIIKKLSDLGKNREFSEDHRKNLSESAKSRKGNKPSTFKGQKYEDYMTEEKAKEVKEKLSAATKGKTFEEIHGEEKAKELKDQMSNRLKGRSIGPFSEEHKENLKIAFKYRDKKRKFIRINMLISELESVNLEDLPDFKYLRKILSKLIKSDVDCSNFIHIEEYIKKCSSKLRSEANRGRKHSEETKRKLSKFRLDHPINEETRQKISEANRGRKHSEETKRKIAEASRNKKHTEETCQKISESNKGKIISQDAKEKISKTLGTKIEIDGNLYYGYLAAQKVLLIDRHTIKKRCLSEKWPNYKKL
jgi:hypothetical protein